MAKSTKTDETTGDAGATKAAKKVQQTMDEATEQGFFGTATDPTPNEHYTLAGVVAGKPTPETERRDGVRQSIPVANTDGTISNQ